jgi:hypothetical protein
VSDRIDRAVAKSILAAEGAAIGGAIGGPVGAGVGAVAGLIIGDATVVFPLDMIAIPAYQAYMLNGTPAMQVYIRAGETLMPTGGNVADVMEAEAAVTVTASKPKRKVSKYNRAYAKAFKTVAPRYKKKDGGWMKDGFKRAQREAHRMAKGARK